MDGSGGFGASPGAAFVDLHCHTSASFDSLADPLKVVLTARDRGITHLAITDHDRIDGALRARDAAIPGITVIVGEEVKTTEGDLICLFLQEAIPPGLPPAEAIARARAQGALVGIPHPFDSYRGSMGKAAEELEALVGLVDWVEAFNARVVGGKGNEKAAELARTAGIPGVAVSDAHSTLEVGIAATRMEGDPSTPAGLLAALASGADRSRPRFVLRPGDHTVRQARPARPRERPGPVRRPGRSRRRGPASPRAAPARRPMSAAPEAATPAPEPEREVTAEQLSLGRRLRQPRTIISIAVPLAIIAAFVGLNWNQLQRVPELILAANPVLVLAAFVVYYLGFPLRGYRWALLLRGTGFYCPTKDATEIIFLSWLVNCVVPAKLGDIYRAYLLKINSDASLSRTFGTVFIERVLDLFVIVILGLAAGFWSFRGQLPPEIQVVVGIGVGVMVVLALGLLFLRRVGARLLGALPLPRKQTILELYERFEEGVFGAIGWRALPRLLVITGLIWMTESLRLWFVVQALGFPDVQLGISGAVFVALIGSLLTAVPLSPAGLGIVEAGIIGVLTLVYNVPLAEATAIALLDRVISVFSVIILGSIAYVLSPKPRGEGRIPPAPAGYFATA